MKFIKRTLSLVFILVAYTACSNMPIYHDLTESEANEILVALQDNHIEAKKIRNEKSQQVSWSVEVAGRDAAVARKVLVENNLPHKKELGFSGICKEKGLIPTPQEEKCRRILALKGEIINSLSRIPGVIESDVVLNVPEISEFSTETQGAKRPTASAVLRIRKNAEGMELTESKIQRFISNSVENLDPRDVSVVITYVENPFENQNKPGAHPIATTSVAGLQMGASSQGTFKVYALVVLGLLMAVSAALVLSVFKVLQLRKKLKVVQMGEEVSVVSPQEAKLLSGPNAVEVPQLASRPQNAPKN